MHRIGDIIDDRYQLTRPLGVRRGAEMWEAQHQVVGRRVTLKLVPSEVGVDPAVRRGLAAEARAAAEVGHASVVEVYDLRVLPNGLAYLVTEPLRGETLADIISRQGAMPAEDACQVTLQVLAGLEAGHAVDIVHGDLRTENVILRKGPSGQLLVKLLDFGLSSDRGDSPSGPPQSAPRPALAADIRADIQGVAVMLYEMLTGRSMAQKDPARALAGGSGQSSDTAQSLVPAIPAALARIVDQALFGSSRGVPGATTSAKEMAAQLAPFAVSERPPSIAPRDSMMPFLSPEARKSRGMARLERAVLGITEAKEKSSVRPNLVLLDSAPESTGIRPFTTDSPDLLEPRIPRPPRSPKHLGSSLPRFSRSDRFEITARPRRRSTAPRRWRATKAAKVMPSPQKLEVHSDRASEITTAPMRLWWAGLLTVMGLGVGLLLARLLHL